MLLHQHGSDAEDKAVYKAMERAVKAKKIRSIGISNYYTEKTAKRFFADFEIKPAVVQNENHVFYQIMSRCRCISICVDRFDNFHNIKPYNRIGEYISDISLVGERSFLKHFEVCQHTVLYDVVDDLIHEVNLPIIKVNIVEILGKSLFCGSHIKANNFSNKR